MGFVSSLLNPGMGQGYQAGGADVQRGANAEQLKNAYAESNHTIDLQKQFLDQLAAQGGVQNQSNVFNQQQQLANQLGTQAQGGGPNPALAQLNQATGANVANQAALMAGQRGSNANVGLLARQAAQQGANTEQQAVGQGAVLKAQQQLAAQGALQNQQQMLGNTAAQQVNQQSAGIGQLGSITQGEQSILQNANSSANTANVGMQSNINSANSNIANTNASNQSKLLGGGLNAAGGIGSLISQGMTQKAEGGLIGPASFAGKHFKNMAAGGHVADFTLGGKLPGKAEVAGDSYQNDRVPIMGSPGEIMLPRSIAMHPNAPEKAAEFVRAILAKKGSLK